VESLGEIETELVDLRNVPLGQARQAHRALAVPLEELLRQVERPRINQGTNPPGRAD
jgi:hypothetical protein